MSDGSLWSPTSAEHALTVLCRLQVGNGELVILEGLCMSAERAKQMKHWVSCEDGLLKPCQNHGDG